jgi:hypothetical protein
MSSKKIQSTRNYGLFHRSTENRPLDEKKHRKLEASMRQYGFLECFPIVCFRDDKGNLIVKDGQHRLAFAETLELPIHWVEEKVDFDVAVINCTSKTWALKDYALKHGANGHKDYLLGLEFAAQHALPIGTAFCLLAGTTTFSNFQDQFFDGSFKIKDRAWADAVASIYGPMVLLSASLKNARFIEACMAVCRVKEFDPKRLLAGAERCRETLVNYTTRDAYLDMMEEVYNFGRKQLFGLKVAAVMAMRERNAAGKSQKRTKKTNGEAA